MDGNFYGTTSEGGAYRHGTVFKMTPSGALTTLYSFNSTYGQEPWAGLIQTPDGMLYGTTLTGGVSGNGTVFKITAEGVLTSLHSFSVTDGAYPIGSLLLADDGNLYGTTQYGGVNQTTGTSIESALVAF